MEEVSQLGCVGSGNKLQRQKKGPWSSGKRKAERKYLGEVKGERREHAPERVCIQGKKEVGKNMGI